MRRNTLWAFSAAWTATALHTAFSPPTTTTSLGARRAISSPTSAGSEHGSVNRIGPERRSDSAPVASASGNVSPLVRYTRSAPPLQPFWLTATEVVKRVVPLSRLVRLDGVGLVAGVGALS